MNTRAKRAAGLAVVPTVGAALVLGALGPVQASSHREAPMISKDPVADNTDVYAFVAPDKPTHVNLIANVFPFEEPAGGPTFYQFGDDVLYRINIDNDGDARADVMYDFRFKTHIKNPDTFLYATGPVTNVHDKDLNITQTYDVWRIVDGVAKMEAENLPTAPNNVGPVTTPNYEQTAQSAVRLIRNGTRVFAGQREDPFFADTGSIFDLGQLRPFKQAYKPAPGDAPQRGQDNFAGYNVNTLALQVPMAAVTKDARAVASATADNAVIGVWATTYRRQTRVLSATGGPSTNSGSWVQVSRLGNPLVNEVVIPLRDKDVWNSSEPRNDEQFAEYVLNPELGELIPALYGVPTPKAPRNDLATIFLTGIPGLNQPKNVVPSEQLRLNLGVKPAANPNPLGVLGGDNAGYPNGRRLGDDVVDIAIRAVAGGTPLTPEFNKSPNNDLGDGVNMNDRRSLGSFPYVGTPFSGFFSPHSKPGSTSTIPLPDQK